MAEDSNKEEEEVKEEVVEAAKAEAIVNPDAEIKIPEAKPKLDPDEIIFFDKDYGKVLKKDEVDRVGNKYVYMNKKTRSKNVAFGTRKSIYSFYHIDEEDELGLKEEKPKKERRGRDRKK
ncbi:hypothetical protein JKY72_05190 [Candidatus Gracilibacteria bacterium]|nr:hypothetical protein [Candidatus Gracilibacteria bacterium]